MLRACFSCGERFLASNLHIRVEGLCLDATITWVNEKCTGLEEIEGHYIQL